ncbi:MAG: alpha/beta hydrolase [Cyanobacteria bacterium TGS_CYA1]|nr:alpha/beta hydrolase [Cyanobacteria bacterium TGS_CYA1]
MSAMPLRIRRYHNYFISLCLSLFFGAFALIPVQAFKAKESGPPIIKVPVFFASDRLKITSNKDESGSKLGPLKLGFAEALLPVSRTYLQDNNLLPSLTHLGCSLDQNLRTFEPYIEIRGYVAEPEAKDFLQNVEVTRDFWSRLAKASEESKTVYVYIHGFASSGENSLYSAGIMSASVEAPVVSFTWPSKGTAGLKIPKLWGRKRLRALYLSDREMIDDKQVMSDLTTFLKDLKSKLPVDTKIILVAHSLGNRLMARYLVTDANEHFERVYFIAPDVDNDLFVQVAGSLKKKAKYVAVFHNPKDRVLKISAANDLLSLKNTDKLGVGGADLTGIEFIDYGSIAEPRSIEFLRVLHYLPFEHFGRITRNGISMLSDDGEACFIVHRSVIEKRKKAKVQK